MLERLAVERHHRVCELGVGSGETTARLARMCAAVTGFEISAPTVEALRYLERRHENLQLVVADVTAEGTLAPYARQFDRALSCDTLEHVPDPGGFFRGIATLLRPGGELVVTFPNERAGTMHGVTRFDSPLELAHLVAEAGLTDVRLGAARLTPHAEKIARTLGWRPLWWAREAVAVGRALYAMTGLRRDGDEYAADEEAPQTFEETRFFRNMKLWRPLSPAVNLYWFGVLRMMAARGPSFDVDWDFTDTPFGDCQVLIAGRKPTETT